MRAHVRYVIAALSMCWVLAAAAGAQRPVNIAARAVIDYGNGRFMIVLPGDTLMGIPPKDVREALEKDSELARLRGEVAAKDSLIAQFRRTVNSSDALIAKFKSYDDTLTKQMEGYRNLAALVEKYHARGTRISLEVGGGVTGGEPALLGGLAIFRVRAWTFIQKDNIGAMLGANLPIW